MNIWTTITVYHRRSPDSQKAARICFGEKSSDTQGERKHNGSREASRFAEHAQTKAQILKEVLNPVYSAGSAAFLFGLLDTAQVEARAAVRLFLRHPLRDVFLGFSFEVSRNSSSNSRSACAQRNNERSRNGIVNRLCSGRISDPPLLRNCWLLGRGRY